MNFERGKSVSEIKTSLRDHKLLKGDIRRNGNGIYICFGRSSDNTSNLWARLGSLITKKNGDDFFVFPMEPKLRISDYMDFDLKQGKLEENIKEEIKKQFRTNFYAKRTLKLLAEKDIIPRL